MNEDPQDGMWPHFVPLWTELRAIAPQLLLAGGYGLFLKQRWLLDQSRSITTETGETLVTERGESLIAVQVPTLVEINRWNDATPRVTKDFDFVVSLELIASGAEQKLLDAALSKHGFKVVPTNARWQFEKKITADQSVLLDFHAPSPSEPRDDLRVKSRRVKPARSLDSTGIHGRVNPETNNAQLHAFSFTFRSVEIAVPNPVSFATMKLVAMHDRRRAALDATKSEAGRSVDEKLARKHAEDLMRIMAMTTRAESESVANILEVVRATPSHAAAAKAFIEYFQPDTGWGTAAVSRDWREDDLALMRRTLGAWFGPDHSASPA